MQISKFATRYMIALMIAFISIYALFLAEMISLGQYFSLVYMMLGIGLLAIGAYQMTGREAFDFNVILNFFIRKQNHHMYDTDRMLKEMGTVMIVSGVLIIAGSFIYYITDIFGAVVSMFIIAVVVSAAFFISCRNSRYLKDEYKAVC